MRLSEIAIWLAEKPGRDFKMKVHDNLAVVFLRDGDFSVERAQTLHCVERSHADILGLEVRDAISELERAKEG